MKPKLIRLFALALAVVAAPSVWAQTTGRITGKVVDAAGAVLPGVAVTVTSPALQGSLSTTTGNDGEFRLLAVPPGTYTLKAALAGFKTVTQPNIVVGLDRTVTLSLSMAVAPVAETVEVTAESPVIDTSSSTTGVNATPELFQRIPMQRSFTDVARVASGTQTDSVGTSFYGSSGAENAYLIEGLNTTGVRSGTTATVDGASVVQNAAGKALNLDFIDEIEVKTSGLPAEYGRTTGGLFNVLTKSGGNEFKGSAFGFFEGKGLAADNTTAGDRPQRTTQVTAIDKKYDFGADVGGYLAKDKLWFFGAYNRVSQSNNVTVIQPLSAPGSPALGSVIPVDYTKDLFSGKVTYKLAMNHTLTGTVFGDPGTTKGAVFNISGAPSTWQGTRDTGGTDYAARYDGVFTGSFLVRAQYGRHKETSKYGGAGRDTAQLINQTVTPSVTTGGFGFFSDETYTRDTVRMDLSRFVGSHEFKIGGDFEKINDDVLNFQGGAGQRIYALRVASTGQVYFRHRYYIDDLAAGFDRGNPASWKIALPQVSRPSTKNLAGYLQDSWAIAKGFKLNLGVRWEQQDVLNRNGESAFKLSDNWAPRIGFVWDVKNNGKSKLYAHYGRFYENIPQDINIRSFGGEVVCFCYNFSSSAADIRPDPTAPARSTLLGGSEPVDPDLKGQYINEVIGGFEYEVAKGFSVGVKATHRNLARVIEDFLVPSSGEYFIANPAEGTLGQSLAFYDGEHTAASPKAKRKNLAFELTARKRFSNNWQFLGSYLWSKLEGNYDGTFQNSTGQLDPNINSAFDYADFLINADGHLSAERQHQFKIDGSYQFGKGLNLGLSTYWYSGLPQTAYGYSRAYANWEYYLTPRGSLGRGPSSWETNVHADYPIKIGSKQRLNVIVDVFNLFDRQSIIQRDEHYNEVANGTCAGVPQCNGDGGLLTQPNTLTPVAQLANPRGTAPNPGFLNKGVLFTLPRSIRLGARFTF
jgi:hypothetical protein